MEITNLIKTILTTSPDTLDYFIGLVDSDLLSKQEKSAIHFLMDNSEDLPSVQYFSEKFPELAYSLSNATALEGNDIKVEFKAFIKSRQNLALSHKISDLSSRAAAGGITMEDIDVIRQSLFVNETPVRIDLDTSEDFIKLYDSRKNRPVGLRTYISTLDDAIGGLSPGTLSVVAAHVGSYKTMFSLNLAYKNTVWSNYNVCYISLEVPKIDIIFNLLCCHSVDKKFDKYDYLKHWDIRMNRLSGEEESYLKEVIAPDFFDNKEKGILTVLDETDFKTLSFEEIRHKLEEVDSAMRERTRDKSNPNDKGHGLDAVIVDHINLCKFNGVADKKYSSEYSEGNAYVSFFRKLSLDFKRIDDEVQQLALIIVAQINRQGFESASKSKTRKGEYTLNALAEFNELERAAQYIFTIYTDSDLKPINEAHMQLLKNRNGLTINESFSIYVNPECYTVKQGSELFGDVIPKSVEDIKDFKESEVISLPYAELLNNSGDKLFEDGEIEEPVYRSSDLAQSIVEMQKTNQ